MFNADDIKKMLQHQGLDSFYQSEHSISGESFEFDSSYIVAFEKYISGEHSSMSKSHWNNINLFIDYANNKVAEDHPEYEALKAFDNYLGKVGVNL